MMDPPRLRLRSGSLEARLLRSSPGFEPPAHAQEEVWRRLQGLGVLGALGLGAHTAAAAGKVAGKFLWVWAGGAALVVAIPAAGVATYWAGHRQTPQANLAVVAAKPALHAPSAGDASREAAETPALVAETSRELPRGKTVSHAPPSALRAESLLLATARSKLAAGDASGALDDVARLAAQFPQGELVQEREVVAIDCLSALGDRARTHARAVAFRERFPNSPYTAHVRQVLGL